MTVVEPSARNGASVHLFETHRVAVPHVTKHAAEGLRLHDLCHYYATWLVSEGVPVNDVARLLGYEHVSTTLNWCTHSSRDRYGRARLVFAALTLTPAPEWLISTARRTRASTRA